MKARGIKLFLVSLFFVNTLFSIAATSVNSSLVEGGVIMISPTEGEMRSACFTNVFSSLTTNVFVMTNYTEAVEGDLKIQGADFLIESSGVRFEVNYYISTNKNADRLEALGRAIHLYSTMNPPWFKQYTGGPGNACLLPICENVTQSTTIQDAFFCRDNVVVHVKNLHGGDILAFIQLLDACIIASSVD